MRFNICQNAAEAAQKKRKQKLTNELQTALHNLQRNEAAYNEAVDAFAVERLIYEHAALVCCCRSVLNELKGR